ncbi:MAG: hypothetical protein GPJ54_09035, partial [Candidatus Heimdallarchaeota archaeon]|nr:hypothetical protein [Candidatus Heimdallarchaeota archaeon]
LYHHLKSLNRIIYQNGQNHYKLNEEGQELTAWFLKSDTGTVTVKKINSFTIFINPIFNKLDKNFRVSIIVSFLLTLFGFYYADRSNLIVLGPLIVQNTDKYNVAINILSLFFILTIIGLASYLINRKMDFRQIIAGTLYSLIPTYFTIIILSILSVELNTQFWRFISIILQLLYLVISTASLIRNGMRIERSIIIHLIILYILMFVSYQFI